jgi:DHA3 family macrolide efflux protein-like MFS transporter
MKQQNMRSKTLTFALVWLGQLISLVGSGLTSFALGATVYETSNSVTQYGLVALSTMLPNILLSLLAGALVDRWDRRRVMLFSDLIAGLSTLCIALLFLSGQAKLWQICLTSIISSVCSAFQWPAYAAATTLLVPKKHYSRANGMVQLSQAVSYLISPALAGFLVVRIQVAGVILIDFATFLFAALSLLLVQFPATKPSTDGEAERGSLRQEIAYGLTYLTARPGLMGMLVLFAALNFLMGFVNTLVAPLILAFTTKDVLGTMMSIGGTGMLVGGGVMSVWGGPKRRINGVLGFLFLTGAFILIGGLQPSIYLTTAAAFGFFFCIPFVGASSQAIWQSKVTPDVQGRVFATRSMIAQLAAPVAMLLAGPLADYLFEPLLVTDGLLTGSVGQFIGTGRGRGIGLMFIVAGVLTMLTTIGGYLYPRLRLVEDELPDVITDEEPNDQEQADQQV